MEGTIIKGIGGFYYVHDGRSRVYECRAKGIFRNRGEKPLVGDRVTCDILDEAEGEASVTSICERKNCLIRPAVANVDQALVVFALRDPEPNYNLLDRFLVMMERQSLAPVLVFNKCDLATGKEKEACAAVYEAAGYPVVFISAASGEGLEPVRNLLRRKTSVLAGPSGVGKSTLMNQLKPEAAMETGEISRKIRRGKHTTRHSELFYLEEDTFLMDTPGFTSLEIFADDIPELQKGYPEFSEFAADCRFLDCAHIGERDCGVKKALTEGRCSRVRYENYCQMAGEIRQRKRY